MPNELVKQLIRKKSMSDTIKNIEQFKDKIIQDYPKLKKDDTFQFECKPGISCFNKCCNDVNIFLTPYDIIRLKNRLKINSGAFLENYTILPVEENLKHPVVMLQMNEDDMNCPFVDPEKGCAVYEDRPWACRMFPIGVGSPKDDPEAMHEEFYFLLKEDVCKGFDRGETWTVRDWMEDQKVLEYQVMGDYFKEISLHEHFLKKKHVEPVKLEMFYMVCYDIDRFREFVFESTFLKRFDVAEETLEDMKNDDAELLRFGFQWLRFVIFGEKSMRLRGEYREKIDNKGQK